jgi:nicotinamidase-related amidase
MITTRNNTLLLALLAAVTLSQCGKETPNREGTLLLNSRHQRQVANAQWQSAEAALRWQPLETAVIICDMWDQHWCKGASRRVAEMAQKMDAAVKSLRGRGVRIIHSPSSNMDFYRDTEQRRRMQTAPEHPGALKYAEWFYPDSSREAELPIDDSDGGCDCTPKCPEGSPWTRQIADISIMAEDGISDSGVEIFNYLQKNRIQNVIVMGVHTNMCVLGRPFGLRSLVKQGRNVVLVRDLTDTMYNHEMAPFVSHDEGTGLVIEHVEKYWCPTVESSDFHAM